MFRLLSSLYFIGLGTLSASYAFSFTYSGGFSIFGIGTMLYAGVIGLLCYMIEK